MLSSTLLLKLPSEWQSKMHNEITTKLNLCISDIEIAKNVANDTWRYLSQDNLNKNELTLKLKHHLPDHASDFSEWVMDFAQKTIEYYLETVSKNDDLTSHDNNFRDEKPNDIVNKESKSRIIKNAIKGLSREITKEHMVIDPLDDTLDNLILKEKIAKLQGQTKVCLGVKTKSGKFKAEVEHELNNRKKFRAKSPFYKNLTLVNNGQNPETTSSGDPKMVNNVAKVPKLCMNFPKCQFGDNCRYIHPNNKICKNWPNCFFGEKCAFIHPDK